MSTLGNRHPDHAPEGARDARDVEEHLARRELPAEGGRYLFRARFRPPGLARFWRQEEVGKVREKIELEFAASQGVGRGEVHVCGGVEEEERPGSADSDKKPHAKSDLVDKPLEKGDLVEVVDSLHKGCTGVLVEQCQITGGWECRVNTGVCAKRSVAEVSLRAESLRQLMPFTEESA